MDNWKELKFSVSEFGKRIPFVVEMEATFDVLSDFPASIMPGVTILERHGQKIFPVYDEGISSSAYRSYLQYPQPDHRDYLYGFDPFDQEYPTVGDVLASATNKFKDQLTFVSAEKELKFLDPQIIYRKWLGIEDSGKELTAEPSVLGVYDHPLCPSLKLSNVKEPK